MQKFFKVNQVLQGYLWDVRSIDIEGYENNLAPPFENCLSLTCLTLLFEVGGRDWV